MENDQTGKLLACIMRVVLARRKATGFGPVIPSDLPARQAELAAAEKELLELKDTLDPAVLEDVREFFSMQQSYSIYFNAADAIKEYLRRL